MLSIDQQVTLRLATAADGLALRWLAQLDSRPLPPGPHLVAERDGSIDAALSLSDGTLIANPFLHTAHLGELLRGLARGEPAAQGRPAAATRPRTAPATA
jgi:hypothetical protein